MQRSFHEVIDRKNTSSVKWDNLARRFGDEELLPMWIADMDFMSPRPVIEALKKRADHGIFGYTSLPGSYFEAIETWLQKRHGWSVQRKWICTSPGVVTALSIAVNLFTQPGDGVIIQPPVYYPFFSVIKDNGREVVENPLRLIFRDGQLHYEMDFADLKEKIARSRAKMLILCSPHNPVGRVWTRDELEQLAEICMEHNLLVVSDEIHADIIFPPHRHIPFASLAPEVAMRSVTCLSPSKTFNLAGLNISLTLIPNDQLRKAFHSFLRRFVLNSPNLFSALALETAYRYGEEWLDQLLIYLRENVNYLTRFISEKIPEIRVVEPEGTYLVWLDCRYLGLGDRELEMFMRKEAKLALQHGYKFGQGGEGFVRVNIACPRSLLQEGLQRLEEAIRKRK